MESRSITVIAVDWGKETKKRAAFIGRPQGKGFRIEPVAPPLGGLRVRELIALARCEARESGTPVVVGIDAVLGVPRRFIEVWRKVRPEAPSEFLGYLREIGESGEMLDQGATDPWSPTRPFFSVPKGKGSITRIIAQAGGRDVLWRGIDCRTAAKSPFVLSGIPGTVGSGTRELWRELAPLLSETGRDFAVWPFETTFADVGSSRPIVVAEVYPRAMYSVALCDDLPATRVNIAKTKASARVDALRMLSQVRWVVENTIDVKGLDAAADDEDVFDALMTALAMTRLSLLGRLDESKFADPECEGDILGLGALDLDATVIVVNGGVAGQKTSARNSSGRDVQSSKPKSRSTVVRSPFPESVRFACPILGCDHVFIGSRGGWDAHVGSIRRHLEWRPDLNDAESRKAAYRDEFADWFR